MLSGQPVDDLAFAYSSYDHHVLIHRTMDDGRSDSRYPLHIVSKKVRDLSHSDALMLGQHDCCGMMLIKQRESTFASPCQS